LSSSDTPQTTPSSSSQGHSLIGPLSPIKKPLDHHLRAAVAGHAQIVATIAQHEERDRARQVAIAALASSADLDGS
jgi:hypothetical protein